MWRQLPISVVIDTCSAAIFLLLSFGLRWRPIERLESAARRLALRPALSMTFAGLVILVVRVALLPVMPPPVPTTHDEMSLILEADTFAHGRLANAPLPDWQSFDTFHVIQHPHYISMYPPAQALVMAAGQLLGHPWIGILLLAALMPPALIWMLRGWLPPFWAFLGGFLAGIHLCLNTYWIESYYGGTLAAIAGALVLGALGRIWRNSAMRPSDGVWLSLGAIILANRRPFEGLVLVVSVAGFLLYWILRRARHPVFAAIAPAALPATLLLTLAALWMAYYDWRTIGNPWVTPYQQHVAATMMAPLFVGQKTPAAHLASNPLMQHFYSGELRYAQLRQSHFLRESFLATTTTLRFYFGMPLLATLVCLPCALALRRTAPLAIIGVIGLALCWIELFNFHHYYAPFLGAWLALVIQSLRVLRLWGRPRRIGLVLQRAAVLATIFAALCYTPVAVLRAQTPPWQRPAIAARVASVPGRHLILVRYQPGHIVDYEWVYNGADLARSPVIWARELDPVSNCRLFAQFSDRTFWLAIVKSQQGTVQPLSPQAYGCDSRHAFGSQERSLQNSVTAGSICLRCGAGINHR